jgi:hypothetical protein
MTDHDMSEYDERDDHADTRHTEYLERRTDEEHDIHCQVRDSAPKAIFHHIELKLPTERGWKVLLNDSPYFAAREGVGYSTYSLQPLRAGDTTQYICCGLGQVPIGYMQLVEWERGDE